MATDSLYEPQHGSFSTPSADMQSSGDSCRVPGATDIKRLLKLKAEHEERLKAVSARVKLLNCHEDQVWKDVKVFRQRGDQAEAARWQRQSMKEEQRQLQRDLQAYHESLRERAAHVRASTQHSQAPRLRVFEENKNMAQQVREDSRRLHAALRDVREQSRQSKVVQVEVRRQQKKQQQLRKNLEATRREQMRQDLNALRFAELQEEVQRVDQALAIVEQEEAVALTRLQNSQSVREALVSPGRGLSRASSEMLLPESSSAVQADPPEGAHAEAKVDPQRSGSVTERPASGSLRSGSLRGGHLRSGSTATATSEPRESTASQTPTQPSPSPAGAVGSPAPTPRKAQGVKAKQPKGYNFSPKTRKAAGERRSEAVDEKAA